MWRVGDYGPVPLVAIYPAKIAGGIRRKSMFIITIVRPLNRPIIDIEEGV
jgi:hypothetical protein